jgi:hypothetical protein
MNTLSVTDSELEVLRELIRNALAEDETGTEEYEDALNSLTEKILWYDA